MEWRWRDQEYKRQNLFQQQQLEECHEAIFFTSCIFLKNSSYRCFKSNENGVVASSIFVLKNIYSFKQLSMNWFTGVFKSLMPTGSENKRI